MNKRVPHYSIRKAKNDQYYYVLVAANGEDLARSEMYPSKQNAKRGIDAAIRASANADIRDETGE